jgi:hypothetical protein
VVEKTAIITMMTDTREPVRILMDGFRECSHLSDDGRLTYMGKVIDAIRSDHRDAASTPTPFAEGVISDVRERRIAEGMDPVSPLETLLRAVGGGNVG